MSTPAIVLMTDPSRCSLGDVQYLVQALLEMQQMGEHATPQAFCDHPAAARDFIEAYAHAYPRLVLEDRALPTPDHLQSLITTGQLGPLARPPELAPLGAMHRPAEPNGAMSLPIVVLTLGGSPALFDALQRAPAMRESIRLIDIVPDADAAPVSIAEAVATRGLDGESWADDGSGAQRPALDEMAGASTTDATGLALPDQMNLNVVETADAPGSAPTIAAQGGAPLAAAAATPSSAAQQPAAPIVAEQPAAPALPDPGPAAATTATPAAVTAAAEPVSQPASQPMIARPDDSSLVEPVDAAPIEPAAQSPGPEAQKPADDEEQPPAGGAASNGADKQPDDRGGCDEDGRDVDLADACNGAPEQDDDVSYPPVGSLSAGADIVYPALDQGTPQGALCELASLLLDDGFVDEELASDILAAHQDAGLPVPAGQEAVLPVAARGNGATIEDIPCGFEHEGDDALADADALADSGVARPLHDSDL